MMITIGDPIKEFWLEILENRNEEKNVMLGFFNLSINYAGLLLFCTSLFHTFEILLISLLVKSPIQRISSTCAFPHYRKLPIINNCV